MDIRQKLHEYVDSSDDKLTRLMYALAKAYNEEEDFDRELTDEQIKILEERSKSFQDGSAKTFTWKETKQAAIDRANSKRK